MAPEHSIRLKAFYGLLPAFQVAARRRRMRKLVRILKIKPGTRVLDLGGVADIWEYVPVPLDITLLNLPGGVFSADVDSLHRAALSHHRAQYVEGDACDVRQFGDSSFDLVFSNSVIEHVGPPERQEAFAREVIRLGRSYWVQTPSPWFPIEAHSGVPFYALYPEWLRASLLRRWRKKLPAWWTEYIATTRFLSLRRMAELFPNARTHVEYVLGFPKSYVAYA